LPLATLRLHQAGSGLYLKYVSLFQIAPFSSRALPGTQQGVEPDNWYQEHLSLSEDKSSSVKVKKVFCF